MFLKITKPRLSLRIRLTLLFVIIFGTTTLVFSVFSYYFLDRSLLQDFDDALYNYSIDVSQTLEMGHIDNFFSNPLLVEEGKIFPFPSGTALILLRNKDGKILIQSGKFESFRPLYHKAFAAIANGADSFYETLSLLHAALGSGIKLYVAGSQLEHLGSPAIYKIPNIQEFIKTFAHSV